MLQTRKKLLGVEHPATTIAAWNLATTLLQLEGKKAASSLIERELAWLNDRPQEKLTAQQRRVQQMMAQLKSRPEK